MDEGKERDDLLLRLELSVWLVNLPALDHRDEVRVIECLRRVPVPRDPVRARDLHAIQGEWDLNV